MSIHYVQNVWLCTKGINWLFDKNSLLRSLQLLHAVMNTLEPGNQYVIYKMVVVVVIITVILGVIAFITSIITVS